LARISPDAALRVSKLRDRKLDSAGAIDEPERGQTVSRDETTVRGVLTRLWRPGRPAPPQMEQVGHARTLTK